MFFVHFTHNRSTKAFNLTYSHTIEVGEETNEKGFIKISHERTTVKLEYENKESAIKDFEGLMQAVRCQKTYWKFSNIKEVF